MNPALRLALLTAALACASGAVQAADSSVAQVTQSSLPMPAVLATQPVRAQIRAERAELLRGKAENFLRQFRGMSQDAADHTYEMRNLVEDADGGAHAHFDRRIGGLRAIGADVIVQTDRMGRLVTMHQHARRLNKVNTKPAVGSVRAVLTALREHGGTQTGQPELIVWARGDQPRLAWEVQVQGENSDGLPFQKHVIVDAANGQQLEVWDEVQTVAAIGVGRTLYSGNMIVMTNPVPGGYQLMDPTRGYTYTIDLAHRTDSTNTRATGALVTSVNNVWGDQTTRNAQSAAADVQYGTAMTWDYYLNVHGRLGIAGNGVGSYNRVHYGTKINNSFWLDSCFCMAYGDGDGVTLRPLVSLDVAAHEMTHGVTYATAGLIYTGESGALNESTSDIFGSMVEFYANNPNDPGDYYIGEKIMVRGGAARIMQWPSLDSYSVDCWFPGIGNLDSHASSGVGNHFFFLLAEGTNGPFGKSPTCVAGNTRNATGSGVLVGIGRAAAEKIWYRALTTKFTSSTDYAGARAGTIAAASELAATLGVDYSPQVAAAWDAVGRY